MGAHVSAAVGSAAPDFALVDGREDRPTWFSEIRGPGRTVAIFLRHFG